MVLKAEVCLHTLAIPAGLEHLPCAELRPGAPARPGLGGRSGFSHRQRPQGVWVLGS